MNMSEKDEQMDRVPSDVIYGLTLDGRGGMQPLVAGSEIPA
ncbi:zinc transporter ZntB, partial [Aeromonas hydrophila]|nr:zinc transporter ZntB [Aeromonas hydrophila]